MASMPLEDALRDFIIERCVISDKAWWPLDHFHFAFARWAISAGRLNDHPDLSAVRDTLRAGGYHLELNYSDGREMINDLRLARLGEPPSGGRRGRS